MLQINLWTYILFTFQVIVFFISIYYFGISIFSLFLKSEKQNTKNKLHSFAIVTSAHNEENVIGDLITSLKNINYPAELYDIFVIADNCTDSTAAIAKNCGANVIRRTNNLQKGKGYALEYAFNYIFNLETKYDYIAVFDADNEVSANFLTSMNKKINSGYKVVQGYLDSKNPFSSWITFSYSLWYWINNRLSQLARYNLGIGCQLGGTGFVTETELLREVGWGATCLAEDTEFTLKLALLDIKVGWCHEAVVYDEKPITMGVSWHQRKRWVQGLADVGSRYIKPLFIKAVKEKKAEPIHAILNLWGATLYPSSIAVMSLIALKSWIGISNTAVSQLSSGVWGTSLNFLILNLFLITSAVIIPLALHCDKKLSKRVAAGIFSFLIYNLTWIPVGIIGALKKNNTSWYHTPHLGNKIKNK